MSVALVIDQSVTFDTMRKINASLTALQGAFAPYDEVAVFTYNNGVKEQTGFSGGQSTRVTYALENSKSQGREPLMPLGGPLACTTCKNNLAVDPNTNGNNNITLQQQQTPPREYHTLNDAILQAAETVAKAGPGRRRVIYVISDGKEYGSQAKEKEVIKFLQTNQITVFATLVGDTSVPGVDFLDKFHLPLTMRDNALPRYVDHYRRRLRRGVPAADHPERLRQADRTGPGAVHGGLLQPRAVHRRQVPHQRGPRHAAEPRSHCAQGLLPESRAARHAGAARHLVQHHGTGGDTRGRIADHRRGHAVTDVP